MALGSLERYRVLGLLLAVGNLFSLYLIRTFGGSRAVEGGVVVGEANGLIVVLAATSVVASAAIALVVLSCFVSFYRGALRNRFVGEDFVPSWTDLAMVVALLVTSGVVALAAW